MFKGAEEYSLECKADTLVDRRQRIHSKKKKVQGPTVPYNQIARLRQSSSFQPIIGVAVSLSDAAEAL